MPNKMLSKSRYINGLQCPRLLWIATNEPSRIPKPDASTQYIFDQGHEVGELAKKLFPGGVDIPDENFTANLSMTKDLMKQRIPLFEAGILSGRIFSRLDILNPVNSDEWDIIEVKSSTSLKDVYLHDISFQKQVCQDSGLKIRKCFLACINNKYVRDGEIVPEELFTVQDISDEVTSDSHGLRARIAEMLKVIDLKSCPEMKIGSHCSDPYKCALTDCWEGLPEHNIFTLYYEGKKESDLYQQGVVAISDIPSDFKLNDKQRIQYECVATGVPHLQKGEVKQFLKTLKYPLYYLDFETFNTAIPLFDGTRPFQKIPFQFSLHVQDTADSESKHRSFLMEGKQDPRLELLKSLSKLISDKGTLIAYNKSFEANVLLDLGKTFPGYVDFTEQAVSMLVDLMVPFSNFHYYHPSQKGSYTIKKVLLALTGKGYEDMAIAEGNDASLAFLSITFDDIPGEDVLRIRKDLLDYCELDSRGMVE